MTNTAPTTGELDKRLEPRSFRRGLTLHVRTSAQGVVQQAQLRNMSKSGVELETRVFIPAGTSLAFTFGLDRFVTQVRWCDQTSSGFVLGAEIQEIDSAARETPLTTQANQAS
jgi:hypothetical protein